MSHFTVLVVLPEQPTPENKLLEKALQPFHEFECTGTVDEYVQSIDRLPELKKRYETDTALMVVKRPDGSKFYAFSPAGNYVDELRPFYDDQKRELVLPDGWEEMPSRTELIKDYVDFLSYCMNEKGCTVLMGDAEPDLHGEQKYGWVRVRDGEVVEVIDRTNPNAKWDWWQIGGRWRGMLVVKDADQARTGRDGVMGSNFDPEGHDIAQASNLDWDQMKAQKVASRRRSVFEGIQEAGIEYEQALKTWEAFVDALPADRRTFDAQRETEGGIPAYHAWIDALPDDSPVKKFYRGPLSQYWGSFAAGIPTDERDPMAWIVKAPALTTYACLIDGEWIARGEMGWFGMSDDDMTQSEWDAAYEERLRNLPPDHWVAVVDCHI